MKTYKLTITKEFIEVVDGPNDKYCGKLFEFTPETPCVLIFGQSGGAWLVSSIIRQFDSLIIYYTLLDEMRWNK